MTHTHLPMFVNEKLCARAESTHLSLEICGGGGEGVGNGGGLVQPGQAGGVSGARNGALPIVWCPKHGRVLREILSPREGRSREPTGFPRGVPSREEGGVDIVFPSHEVESSDLWLGSTDGGKESEGDAKGLESPALSRLSSTIQGQQDGVLPARWFRRLWRFAEISSGPSTEGDTRVPNGNGYRGGGDEDDGSHQLGGVHDLKRFPARGIAPDVVEEASRASDPSALGKTWRGQRLDEVVAAGADGELGMETSGIVKGSDVGIQARHPRGLGSTEEKNPQKGTEVVVFGEDVAPEEAITRESANPEGNVSRNEAMTENNVEGVESEKAVLEIDSTGKGVSVVGISEGGVPGVGATSDGMMPKEEVKPESAGQEEATSQQEALGVESGKDIERARQQDTAEGEGEGGVGSVPGVVLAWIPGDPCSCIDSPGIVGQACRAWLSARAVSMPQVSKVKVKGAGFGLG